MTSPKPHIDASWLRTWVEGFVFRSPENSLGFEQTEKIFDRPLVGFASGSDPLWQVYRDHIGGFYVTPVDFFKTASPGETVTPVELTVVSWVLPSTSATRQEHAKQTRYPSKRWVRTRHYGELFNVALRRSLDQNQ